MTRRDCHATETTLAILCVVAIVLLLGLTIRCVVGAY